MAEMWTHQPFHYHSPEQHAQDIKRLGLDIPITTDLSPLCEPIECGRFRLPNRFVVLPMEGCDGTSGGAPDESGRRRPEVIPETEHMLPCETAVEAIGQSVYEAILAALPGVEFTRRGTVATRPGSLETTRARVWAAGDLVNGGATVVQAVAEGMRAAREIDAALKAAGVTGGR